MGSHVGSERGHVRAETLSDRANVLRVGGRIREDCLLLVKKSLALSEKTRVRLIRDGDLCHDTDIGSRQSVL